MKKGFTLIELLAVILILGIIALIAIPTVNNILKESRRGAFSSTLTNIEKAIEEKCTTEQIKNQEITTEYVIENGVISPKLDIKGDLPDGIIYVNKDCEVSYTLSDNNFTGTKEIGGEVVIGEKGNTTTVYKESILNGTDPVLKDNLIPVTIDNDGIVKKADLTTKWYSYAEKKWANAVILTPTGKVEEDGTILEDSIESYFVWIPRYKYKLFAEENYSSLITSVAPPQSAPKSIEIIFENKNTQVSNGTGEDGYYSHPAFIGFDVNGLWVGKFETTGSSSNPTIKPNEVALGEMSVKSKFELSYNYKRGIDSHMMKNTEWGAVVYLSLSTYGINTEVRINNNSSRITGYSAAMGIDQSTYPGISGTDETITLPYNTETGYLASTTGNITGVYDMSGGSNEVMAAYIEGSLGNSGFDSDPTILYGNKYFDKYPSNSNLSSYNNRILGDATGEFGPFYYIDYLYKNNWYRDVSHFIEPANPWFLRSGDASYGSIAGPLFFYYDKGAETSVSSFRIVLAN